MVSLYITSIYTVEMTKELCRRLGDNVIQNVVIMIVTVYLSLTKTVDKLYEMLLLYIV
jgi:hypothetical protein